MSYYAFVGQTAGGKILSDMECRRYMTLPVVQFTTDGIAHGERNGQTVQSPHPFDALIQTEPFLKRALSETDTARHDEIAWIQEKARRDKSELSRKMESLKNDLHQVEYALSRASNVTERINAEKRRATANRELKQREQAFFMEGLQIDAKAERKIQGLIDDANLCAVSSRLFTIEMRCKE